MRSLACGNVDYTVSLHGQRCGIQLDCGTHLLVCAKGPPIQSSVANERANECGLFGFVLAYLPLAFHRKWLTQVNELTISFYLE